MSELIYRFPGFKMVVRVVLRLLVLLVAVLGLSLAFAWVWDRAEPRPAALTGDAAPALPPVVSDRLAA